MHIVPCLIPPLVWTVVVEVVIYIYDIHKYPFQKLVLLKHPHIHWFWCSTYCDNLIIIIIIIIALTFVIPPRNRCPVPCQ